MRKMTGENFGKKISLIFIGFFLFLFAIQLVSANVVGDWFGQTISDWQSGEVSEGFAKILLGLLIAILVQTIVGKIPGLSDLSEKAGGLFGWVFAIIIAFLSIAYVTPDEVYSIMSGYSALGYTLAGGIPFVILTFFTINLALENKGSASERVGKVLISRLLWVAFILFGFYRMAMVSEGQEVNWLILAIFPIGGIFMLLGLGSIFNWVKDTKEKEVLDTAKRKTEKATKKTKMDAAAVDELGDA